jgi:DNA-binding GntR family transcriptional regulator
MIWSEMAVRLRTPGQGTDMVHRIVEALRDEISAGSLAGGSRITGEKELSAILGVSRSTLREALRILVHEGLLVSRWGVGTFVTDQLPSIVKGRTTDVNVPLPLQWIEPHWTLLTDEEKAVAADDVVAAALDIAPGENVYRRRRTYGISGRILAFADETAAGGGSRSAGRCAVAIDVVTDRSADWAAFFRKDEPLLRIHQTLYDKDRRPQRLNIVIRSTQNVHSGPLRLQE